MAARFVRDEEAAGSNPATPTQLKAVPTLELTLIYLDSSKAFPFESSCWPSLLNALSFCSSVTSV